MRITYLGMTGLLNFVMSASLAVFVWRQCPRRDLGRAYAFLNSMIALHSAFYFLWQCSTNPYAGLFNLRMLTFFGMWVNPALLYFTAVFLGWTVARRNRIIIASAGTVAFSFLNFSNAMYWSVRDSALGYWPVAITGWFTLYLIFWHGELIWAMADFLRSRRQVDGHQREQISYVVAAFAIGYIGGMMNWPMWYGLHIPPYLNCLISVYIFMMAYAMVKHQLMDISVVLKKTLLYSVVSASLAAIYVGTITLAAQALGSRQGSASALSSALAAIFITLLFNPVRIRTQRWIDQQFPHEHLDPDLLQEAAGSFAHEMKRPLTKISLPAQLLLMELERVKNGDTGWKEFLPILEDRLKFIVSQSSDAGYVIEAIRELSSSATPPEPVDLQQCITDALNSNRDILEKHSIKVRIEPLNGSAMVSGRRKQLEIVFINVIKNAVEALSVLPISKARELHIQVHSDKGQIVVDITDNGPGIKQEDFGKLFSARYSTKGQGGTGLGLYLSRQILQGHNGALEVSSHINHGTTFIIRIPAISKTH